MLGTYTQDFTCRDPLFLKLCMKMWSFVFIKVYPSTTADNQSITQALGLCELCPLLAIYNFESALSTKFP
jgi:hypothetical protein